MVRDNNALASRTKENIYVFRTSRHYKGNPPHPGQPEHGNVSGLVYQVQPKTPKPQRKRRTKYSQLNTDENKRPTVSGKQGEQPAAGADTPPNHMWTNRKS